ncbi:PREDICTED: auxin-responsive protein IAA29-like isoform X2 [Camelina sativa]|uniref:Auxin-responsive protein n=1 Tax=Camelina sativa TaxID=90675 RepID=A0ABM0U9J1_CAMSA|nr:PREDICTED: auxin-responsive protein IAA29-like isoform X2 [Camelina sativa]
MELDLGLSLSPHTNSSKLGFDFDLNKHCAFDVSTASRLDSEKLHFEATFRSNIEEDCYVPKPSVFALNDRPNEEDEDPLESESSTVYERITAVMNNRMATVESVGSSSTISSRSSMYVKVKMDGVAIARKVDIKLFNSYESLTDSLITMFTQYEDCEREDTNYAFIFQGKEGDWLLPGDVPWRIFAESVHRISIIRDRPCAYTRLLF